MLLKTIKNICLTCSVILIIFYPTEISALSHDWIAVPKSQYGKQFWDKSSVAKNQEGLIRVLSKFVPKNATNITQDILYTMDINCEEKSFRDVAVGSNKFNEFENEDTDWKNPNGDELILSVINQVCASIN